MRKRFGQHLLKNPDVVAQIVAQAELMPHETVFEIGPGTGNLTVHLLKVAKTVYAVELDSRLYDILQRRVESLGPEFPGQLECVRADFLHVPLPKFDALVANIPYQISSPVLQRLFTHTPQPRVAVIMFQKEFAERMVAKPGTSNYCRLSVNSQLLADCELVMRIPASQFRPPPKVDSAIIRMYPRGWPEDLDFAQWDAMLRVLFAGKNKTMRSLLTGSKTTVAMLALNRTSPSPSYSYTPSGVLDTRIEEEQPSTREAVRTAAGVLPYETFISTRQEIDSILQNLGGSTWRPNACSIGRFRALYDALREAGFLFVSPGSTAPLFEDLELEADAMPSTSSEESPDHEESIDFPKIPGYISSLADIAPPNAVSDTEDATDSDIATTAPGTWRSLTGWAGGSGPGVRESTRRRAEIRKQRPTKSWAELAAEEAEQYRRRRSIEKAEMESAAVAELVRSILAGQGVDAQTSVASAKERVEKAIAVLKLYISTAEVENGLVFQDSSSNTKAYLQRILEDLEQESENFDSAKELSGTVGGTGVVISESGLRSEHRGSSDVLDAVADGSFDDEGGTVSRRSRNVFVQSFPHRAASKCQDPSPTSITDSVLGDIQRSLKEIRLVNRVIDADRSQGGEDINSLSMGQKSMGPKTPVTWKDELPKSGTRAKTVTEARKMIKRNLRNNLAEDAAYVNSVLEKNSRNLEMF